MLPKNDYNNDFLVPIDVSSFPVPESIPMANFMLPPQIDDYAKDGGPEAV